MEEKTTIILLVTILTIIGLGVFSFSLGYNEFNFYKSELTINGNKINEKIYFKPDQKYHTLFRNFNSPIKFSNKTSLKNYILIKNVSCSEPNAYARDNTGSCKFFEEQFPQESIYGTKKSCPAYTENNEFGCTGGLSYKFYPSKEYTIEAEYELIPNTIFRVNGKDYIKFVAYEENRHVSLDKNNFIIKGNAIMKDSYYYKDQVIIYVPYKGNLQGKKIETINDFEYSNNFILIFLSLLIAISPGASIFLIWYFFGKENIKVDLPSEISFHPTERNPWEVAAYFNPPFRTIDNKFFASILINLYQRKIIDIKMNKNNPLIKFNKTSTGMDNKEKKFLDILSNLKEKNKFIDNQGYLDLKKALHSWKNRSYVQSEFRKMQIEIKKEGKRFIKSTGGTVMTIFSFIGIFSLQIIGLIINPLFSILIFFSSFAIIILNRISPLFIKFKENYYKEYRHWQAYKKYLSHSFSIKSGSHKAVVIWDKIIVYATALGVAKKVLKELKEHGIIDESHYGIYHGIYVSSGNFATSTGTGGGMGGAGGGGVGGGGGGGR